MSIEHLTIKTNCVIWRNVHLPHPNKNHKSPIFSIDGFNCYVGVSCTWSTSCQEVWNFAVHQSNSPNLLNTYVIIPYAETAGKYVRLDSTISGTNIWRSSLSSILGSDKDIITLLFFFAPHSLNKPPHVKNKSVQILEEKFSEEESLCLESLSEDIVQLFNQDGYADVTLKCGEKSFSVHRNILAARSSVFSAMFEHDMSEKNTGVVNIVDLDSDILEQFLLYLYSGKIEQMCMDTAIELYKTAEKYAVHSLKQSCASYILSNLTEDTVCKVLLLADQAGDIKFVDSISSFAVKIEEFFESKSGKIFLQNFQLWLLKCILSILRGKEQTLDFSRVKDN